MSTPDQPNYPGNNPPYPGGQPNYPGGQPNYPGGGPSYPGGGQPNYPGSGPSYPGGQPTYPSGGPSYPGGQPNYPPYPSPGANPYAAGAYPGGPGFPGGQPGYPGGAGLPPAPARPNTVNAAFWCWIATTVVSLVTLILTLTSPVWDQAVAAGLRTSGGVQLDVNSVVTTAKVIIVVVFLIFAAVYLLFAFKMWAGRNWARIVLTVFGALAVLTALTPTTGSVTVGSQTFTATNSAMAYVSAVLAVVGIVLMYLKPSNEYFTNSKAYRSSLG